MTQMETYQLPRDVTLNELGKIANAKPIYKLVVIDDDQFISTWVRSGSIRNNNTQEITHVYKVKKVTEARHNFRNGIQCLPSRYIFLNNGIFSPYMYRRTAYLGKKCAMLKLYPLSPVKLFFSGIGIMKVYVDSVIWEGEETHRDNIFDWHEEIRDLPDFLHIHPYNVPLDPLLRKEMSEWLVNKYESGFTPKEVSKMHLEISTLTDENKRRSIK